MLQHAFAAERVQVEGVSREGVARVSPDGLGEQQARIAPVDVEALQHGVAELLQGDFAPVMREVVVVREGVEARAGSASCEAG